MAKFNYALLIFLLLLSIAFVKFNGAETINVIVSNTPAIPVNGYVLFTASVSGGTGPYTYNYFVVNAVAPTPIIANALYVGNAFSSNSWLWGPVPAGEAKNETLVSINITDSSGTPVTVHAQEDLEIDNAIVVNVISPNTLVDLGQIVILLANTIGGGAQEIGLGGGYSYNFTFSNTLNGNYGFGSICAFQNDIKSGSKTSEKVLNAFIPNTFGLNPNNAAVIQANVQVSETDFGAICIASLPINLTYNSVPALTITPSNSILDSGQWVTWTLHSTGGTGPNFNTELFNITGTSPEKGNVIIKEVGGSNIIGSSNTISYTVSSPTSSNIFTLNGISVDTGTQIPDVFTSTNSQITVNPALSVTLSASNTPSIGANQFEVFTANVIGGSSSYTYNFQVFNSITNTLLANQIFTGVSSTSNSFAWQVPTADIGNSISCNVFVTDSASTPVTANSIKLVPTITINSYVTPNTPSISVSNTIIDIGQSTNISTTVSGGRSPFTYNWIITNTVTGNVVSNQLYTGVSPTANSFIWTPPANFVGNIVQANVIITDTLSNTVNSIKSTPIHINSAPTLTITPSATSLTAGQTETFTLTENGGTGPFTVQLFNVSNSFVQNGASNVIIATPGGSNTISLVTAIAGTFTFNGVATDQGTTFPVVFNSISNTITVTSPPTTTTIGGGGGGGGGGSPGGGGGGSQKPTVTPISSSCVLISNMTVPHTVNFTINSLHYNLTDNYITSNFTSVIINGGTYVLYPSVNVSVENSIYVELLYILYTPIQKTANLKACSIIPVAPPTVTLTPSSSYLTPGQTENYTISINGGTGPFTVNLFNVTGNSTQISNIIIPLPGESNTVSFVTNATGTFTYNAIAIDEGTNSFVFNSIQNSIIIQAPGTAPIVGSPGGGSVFGTVNSTGGRGGLLLTNISDNVNNTLPSNVAVMKVFILNSAGGVVNSATFYQNQTPIQVFYAPNQKLVFSFACNFLTNVQVGTHLYTNQTVGLTNAQGCEANYTASPGTYEVLYKLPVQGAPGGGGTSPANTTGNSTNTKTKSSTSTKLNDWLLLAILALIAMAIMAILLTRRKRKKKPASS
jgi:hypothetical protein